MAQITVKFKSGGADKTLKEIEKISEAARKGVQNVKDLGLALEAIARANISGTTTVKVVQDVGKASRQAASEVEVLGRSTKSTEQRLKEYNDANIRLARTLNAPLTAVKELSREFGKTPQAIEQTARRFAELQKSGANSAQIFSVLQRELGTTTRQFQALQKASSSRLGIQQQVQGVAKELQNASREADALSRRLAQGIKVPDADINRVAQRLTTAQKNAARLGREFGLTNAQAARLKTEVQRASDSTKRLAQNAKQGAQDFTALQRAAGALGGAVALAVGGGISASIQEFGQFDLALAQFQAKAGEASVDLESLSDEAFRLARITSQTPAGVAATATQLLSLGVAADDVEKSLNGVVVLADLLGEDPVLTGKTLQTGVNVFGELGETTDTLAEKINILINTTAAGATEGINEFNQLLSKAGGTAKLAGVDFDQLGAGFSALRATGAVASEAATGLSTVFQRLIAPIGRGRKILEDAGFALENFQDEAGNTNFEELIRFFEQFSEEELINVFGARGIRAITGLLDGVDTIYADALDNIENRSIKLDDSLAILNRALLRQFEILQGQISELLTTIGQRLAPIARAAVSAAQLLVTGFAGLPEPLKLAVLGIVGFAGALGAATAAVVAFQIAQGPLIVSQLTQAASSVKQAVATIAKTKAQSAYNATVGLGTLATQKLTAAQLIEAAASAKAAAAAKSSGVVTKGLALLKGLLAVALGKATLQQLGFNAALLKGLATLGVVAAAVAAVGAAVSVFLDVNQAARELGQATTETRDRIVELQEVLAETGQKPIEEVVENTAANNVLKVQNELNGLNKVLDRLIRGPIPGLATAADAAVTRTRIAFRKLLDESQNLEGEIIRIIENINAGEEVDPAVVEAATNAINDQIETLKNSRAVTAEDVAQRDAQIRRLEKQRANLENAAQSQGILTAAVEEGTEAQEAFSEALQESEAQLNRDIAIAGRDRAQALADAIGANGEIDRSKELAAEKAFLDEKLAANEAYLEELKLLQQDDPENQEVQDKIVSAETEIANTRVEIAKKSADEAAAIEEERVAKLEEELAKAEALVRKSAVEREKATLELERQLRASGASEVEIAEQTAQARLDAERKGIEDQIALQQQRIQGLEAGTSERAEAEIELAELQNNLLQNQIDAEIAARDAQARALEEVQRAQQRANTEAIAGDEQRLASLARIEQSLQRQTDLLQQQAAVSEAAASLQSAVADRQRAQGEAALTLVERRKQIEEELADTSELSAEQVNALKREQEAIETRLSRLGFARNADEQKILQQLIRDEQRRFENERAALERSQALEQASLEIELEKSRLAAQRAVREQELAIRRLEFQRLEIQGEIELARLRGNEQEALDAESRLRLLDEQIAGERELLDIVQASADAEEESAQSQRDLLALQQQQARLDLGQAQEQRALELADRGTQVGGAAQQQAQRLAEDTGRRADQEARASQELATSLDQTTALVDRSGALLDEWRSLADEAERYQAAVSGASSASTGVPSFRVGGVAPGGFTQVHKDEVIYLPKGAQIASQSVSRQEMRKIARMGLASQALSNPAGAIGSIMAPLVGGGVDNRELRLLRRDFQQLAKIMRKQPPPRLELQQNFMQDSPAVRTRAADDAWYWLSRIG